jgi:hypothetical protein
MPIAVGQSVGGDTAVDATDALRFAAMLGILLSHVFVAFLVWAQRAISVAR